MLYATAQHCRICGRLYTPWDGSGACEDCQNNGARCRCGSLLTPAEVEKAQGCCDVCLAECDICERRLPWWDLHEVEDGVRACIACVEGGL